MRTYGRAVQRFDALKIVGKAFAVVGVVALAGSLPMKAQEFPQFQIFAGGSYFRVHASGAEAAAVVGNGVSDLDFQDRNLNFGLYGWQATVTENANRWFGADADFSGQYGTPNAPF